MGATKNNTGGHLKIKGTGKNSNMRGHTKFLGGLKNRGGKAFRGPVTEGCLITALFLCRGRGVCRVMETRLYDPSDYMETRL